MLVLCVFFVVVCLFVFGVFVGGFGVFLLGFFSQKIIMQLKLEFSQVSFKIKKSSCTYPFESCSEVYLYKAWGFFSLHLYK